MSIYEYDREKHMAMERAEAYEKGRKQAEVEIIQLIKNVFNLHEAGKTAEEIAKECNTTIEAVLEILE